MKKRCNTLNKTFFCFVSVLHKLTKYVRLVKLKSNVCTCPTLPFSYFSKILFDCSEGYVTFCIVKFSYNKNEEKLEERSWYCTIHIIGPL